jgi:hypothetical protein
VLDAFRYLGTFGIRNLTGFVSVGDQLVEFGLEADFDYPLVGSVIEAFQDRECSDLILMKGNSYTDNLDVDLAVQYGRASVRVQQPVPAFA